LNTLLKREKERESGVVFSPKKILQG